MKQWARQRLTALKRSRKYRPREADLDPREAQVLRALLDLEKATGRLLEGEVPAPQSPGGVFEQG